MQWHDLLGAVLIDFFDGSPYVVDTEIDLSLKKQLLDIVIIRKNEGEFDRPLPDGFAPLANHNLISFKSHQDTFDWWTVLELLSYYVNYRKQVGPAPDQLLPENEVRLLGITSRFPEKLAKEIRLEETQPGVYDIQCGATPIRLLVIRNLPNEPANAMLKLFSLVPDQVEFACRNYRVHSQYTTGIVDDLIRMYRKEDWKMAKTIADLVREVVVSAPAKVRIEGLTVEEILKVVPREELLKGLSRKELEAYLRQLPAEEAQGD